MKLNYWSNEDDEEFKSVLKVTKSVEKLYNELYQLEISNKQNSPEYNKKIEYLMIALDIENKKYFQANLNKDKRELWKNYINRYYIDEDFLTNYESIIVQNYYDKDIRRVLARSADCFLNQEDIINSLLAKDLERHNMSPDRINEMIIFINNSVENDLLRGYLYYLNEFTNKKEYQSLTNYFIHSKYYLSFINKDIEQEMLKTKFKITDEWYIGSPLIADLMKIESDVFNELKNVYGYNMILNSIYSILVLNDLDYADNVLGSSALMMQCFIKSGLNLVNQDQLPRIKKHYEQLINSKEYLNSHLHDSISIHLVDECLDNSFKKDSKIYYVNIKKK